IASKRKSKSHHFIRVKYTRTLFSWFYPLFLLNRAVLGEYLIHALDEDRLSDRKLFPVELKGITW
ncbi:MAG: hypothetical protein V7L19_28570, partial [Nostoc sp.]